MPNTEKPYHLNPNTGRVGKCDANPNNPRSTGCKFNLGEEEHFATKEEARAAYEKSNVAVPKATVRYSFLKNFQALEEKFKAGFEGIPTRFFNADLRGKAARFDTPFTVDDLDKLHNVEPIRIGDELLKRTDLSPEEARELRLRLLKNMISQRVRSTELSARLAAATSAPSDLTMSDDSVHEIADELGFENFRLNEDDERTRVSWGATKMWTGTINGETVHVFDSAQNSKNLGRYYQRGNRKDGTYMVVDKRILAGLSRVQHKTGENVLKLANDYASQKIDRNEAQLKSMRALAMLEEAQWEGKNFQAQKKYLREQSGKIATAWMDKKNPDKEHVELMKNSSFNKSFRKLEVDNDVAAEELRDFENAYEDVKDKLPAIPKELVPELKVRKLGKHRATGIFFPAKNVLAVDVRDSSSFIHEYGHALDLVVHNSASLSGEFREISQGYSKLLPYDRVGNKAEYFNTPTEQMARLFELYAHERLGIDNRLLNPAKFTERPDFEPFQKDPSLKEKGFAFLDKLFKDHKGDIEGASHEHSHH